MELEIILLNKLPNPTKTNSKVEVGGKGGQGKKGDQEWRWVDMVKLHNAPTKTSDKPHYFVQKHI